MIKLCAFADEAGKSLQEQIEALKRNNINLIELRGIDGENIADISEEKAVNYARVLDENGIKVWAIGSPLGKIDINDDFNKHLELAKHIIKLAGIFGTDKVRVFSFYIHDHEKDRERVIKRLNEMTALAALSDIKLYHENEKDIYGDTLKYVTDILSNVKGLKCVFDPANFIQCRQDINEAIDALAEKADYFHIKDATYENGEVVPAGLGDGEIPRLIDTIKGEKVLTLEPHLKVFDSFANIDRHELKNKYTFKDNNAAFDAAADALKKILKDKGYRENNGVWIK
jgi:sugar phosphate isomerase/epimerase